MIKILVVCFLGGVLSACVSINNTETIKKFFNPEIDSVYVEKNGNKYRLNIILKNFSQDTNKISNTTLYIDGKRYKVRRLNDSKFVSSNFNVRDDFIDIRLKINTLLGKNNPLVFREVLPVKNELGIIVSKNKPKFLKKGTISQGSVTKYLYNNSKALLIGVKEYSKAFDKLPYIDNDIDNLQKVLKQRGVESTKLSGNIKTSSIKKHLYDFVNSSGKNDRLIIYISSHGYTDPNLSNKGYIVSSDCKKSSPHSTCLSLDYFSLISDLAKRKGVKHLLIIIDSCFSGIGIVDKGKSNKSIEAVAYSSGIHMITAGRANQISRMEHELKMSTFTYYLVEGLAGNADLSGGENYKKDGIITLSELFIYVNNTVVKRTNGSQIPSLGRIQGEGEMIFWTQK